MLLKQLNNQPLPQPQAPAHGHNIIFVKIGHQVDSIRDESGRTLIGDMYSCKVKITQNFYKNRTMAVLALLLVVVHLFF